ncbi:glycosyltransferase family 4 protein [Patescibacteria group bacterium]|nr:glycosyltransferase family 4 protein [Patescibacteria group bacterium]MCG2701720.1 glycosyltransferase family 4 protein [Candidatus Parcubacteria bacterium]MBU4210586.1 glycosyltransferase family 4 protein [Patescibacteria group bacterium]MBU4264625.1 glycosyltransferase family 4 protein [Patescibacteria group bacterium]MBU4390580.1 glycosyltransferase family 4 protein [Patescibacteria group bacterium]
MKILLTLFSTSWGGAEESVLQLVEGLSYRGFKVYLLWVSPYKVKLPKMAKVKICRLKMVGWLYRLIASFIIPFICWRYKIQLVNLNWRFVTEESRYLFFLKNVKVVATVRAILLDKNNVVEYRFTDAIIGVSMAVIKRIRRLGYQKKCFVIYNGIKVDKLKKFSLMKMNPCFLLSMSRLVRWKRIDWSIRAVYQLRQEGLSVKLDIFGDGPEKENLNELIMELKASKYIKLLGRIEKNDERLANYGIFLLPSYAEPFGKTLVENVIRGKLIVATKSGAVPELLLGYNLLFKRDIFEDYVQKIRLGINNYSKYRKNILKMEPYFKKYYNMARVVENYKEVYKEILSLK